MSLTIGNWQFTYYKIRHFPIMGTDSGTSRSNLNALKAARKVISFIQYNRCCNEIDIPAVNFQSMFITDIANIIFGFIGLLLCLSIQFSIISNSFLISASMAVLPKPTFFKCFNVNCLCSRQSSPSANVIPEI